MLVTVGHGPLHRDDLAALLRSAEVTTVVDVRRYPGSRTNPDVRAEAMQEWLPSAGIRYRPAAGLGGRRSLPAGAPQLDPWWTVAAFRAYAAHTRTPEFREALVPVLDLARAEQVAVLCSESVWWRCHRRLVADVVLLGHDLPVQHLLPSGRLDDHRPSAGARLRDDGQLVWDVLADEGVEPGPSGAPSPQLSGQDGRSALPSAADGGGA